MTDTIDATNVTDQAEETQRVEIIRALRNIATMVGNRDLPLPDLWEGHSALPWNVLTADEFMTVARAIGATEVKVSHGNVTAIRRVGPLSVRVYTAATNFNPAHVDVSDAIKATVEQALGVTE